jgi:trimeric autotransporter adhesin
MPSLDEGKQRLGIILNPMNKIKKIAQFLFVALVILVGTHQAAAQGTAFTYQGRLNAGASPADGVFDFRFKLYFDAAGDNQAGSTVLTNGLPVTNGLFTATVDFGEGIFNGSNFWLEVDVRTNGAATYNDLMPLQALTPVPYAIFASAASNLSGTLAASQLSGSIPLAQLPAGVVTNNESNVTLSGTLSGNGTGLTNVNAATLHGIGAASFWQLTGNSGTTPGVNYLGTADNQPLELHVNAQRALRLEVGGVSALAAFYGYPNPTGAPNMIGGSPVNSVAAGVVGAVIGGGGATNYFGAGFTNSIGTYSDFSTIGGGVGNTVQYYSVYSVIGGGYDNIVGSNSPNSMIGGGSDNIIETNADNCTIGGGADNTILSNAYASTIGGGFENTAAGVDATVSGGYQNFADANLAAVGGGQNNTNGSQGGTIGGGEENKILTGFQGVIGGGYNNFVSADYATIGGGNGNVNTGVGSFIGGGGFDGSMNAPNVISNNASTIGGGLGNSIVSGGAYSFIGGGQNNTNGSQGGTIAGGQDNYIQTGFQGAIGGGYDNYVSADYATVAGGFQNANSAAGSFIGGGEQNTNYSSDSFIGGGNNNTIWANSYQSTIGGGFENTIQTNAADSTIGGGDNNTIETNSFESAIGGGDYNTIGANSYQSTISGGGYNTIGANCIRATIAGGNINSATGAYSAVAGGLGNSATGVYAAVPGGQDNQAKGVCSIACGNGAIAQAANTFVWADGQANSFPSGGIANTFNVRATGGVWLWSAANASGGGTAGVELKPGETSWSVLSDRNAKKNFKAVNTEAVLQKLAAIPIQQWNYKWEKDDDFPNIGPMAQDFKHAFFPGRDDKSINTLEFDGVELAAIQGLNQKVDEKEARIQDQATEIKNLKQQNDSLAARLNELEATVKELTQKK